MWHGNIQTPNGHCVLQLRLNKVAELIHNSTHHKNLTMARVIVHFQEIIDTVSHKQRRLKTCCCTIMHNYKLQTYTAATTKHTKHV